MKDALRINATEVIRLHQETGKALFRGVYGAIAEEIMEEFHRLVVETPQYSGSAAASWKIGFSGLGMGSPEGGEVLFPKPKLENALQKGHGYAVSIATMANRGALDKMATAHTRADIHVWNSAPSALIAEHGPLRDVNQPGGALQKFGVEMARIRITDGQIRKHAGSPLGWLNE